MTNSTDLVAILKHVDLFSSLDENSLNLLSQNLTRVPFRAGETICAEGEPGGSMYIVESGAIEVIKSGTGDTAVSIATLKPGEVAGIMSLFGDDRRSATMKAAVDSVLWEMRDTVFQNLLSSNPAISKGLFEILSRYLRENIRTVAELRSRDADRRLKIAMFDSKPYMKKSFIERNQERFAIKFFDFRLNADTAFMAAGFRVVCCFVNDIVNAEVVKKLKSQGVELIAMRCSGYNNVDLDACRAHGIGVTTVPVYSPHAIAEHSVMLMMALNRRIIRANARVHDSNFSLDGLVGFNMNGRTAGIVGAGRIGQCTIDIMAGFGCNVLVFDRNRREDPRSNVRYVELDELFRNSDIISLHAPLTPETHHLISEQSIAIMKRGVMIINTGRGALVDSQALIKGLLSGAVGSAGLDVYEEEGGYFFEDFSGKILQDEVLARLTTFPNVIITPHMAFLTEEALLNIADSTLTSINAYADGTPIAELPNILKK